MCASMYVNIVMPQLWFLPTLSFGLDMFVAVTVFRVGHSVTFFFQLDLHNMLRFYHGVFCCSKQMV